MKEYCIMLTHRCNWFCDFCVVDTHNKPTITFDSIKEHLNSIEKGSMVSLSGGEPGLVSEDILIYTLRELKKKECIIAVNTNGLFMKNYQDYLTEINDIYYHCSEHLDAYVPIIDFKNIDYMVVVTDNNIHNLGQFLDTNNDKIIRVTGADIGDNVVGLSKKNMFKIYSIVKDKMNVDKSDLVNLFNHSKTPKLTILV